jgi:hypothetical protein
MELRKLIFETAAASDGVGEITETLKWGEPAYLTAGTKSGSTIRLGWKPSEPRRFAMYFNCQTDLVGSFRASFPDELTCVGSRAVVFEQRQALPANALRFCIRAALTYHLNKGRTPGQKS